MGKDGGGGKETGGLVLFPPAKPVPLFFQGYPMQVWENGSWVSPLICCLPGAILHVLVVYKCSGSLQGGKIFKYEPWEIRILGEFLRRDGFMNHGRSVDSVAQKTHTARSSQKPQVLLLHQCSTMLRRHLKLSSLTDNAQAVVWKGISLDMMTGMKIDVICSLKRSKMNLNIY